MKLGFPVVVKTTRGGYDGKGQQFIENKEELHIAEKLFEHSAVIAEEFVSIYKRNISYCTKKWKWRIVLPSSWRKYS